MKVVSVGPYFFCLWSLVDEARSINTDQAGSDQDRFHFESFNYKAVLAERETHMKHLCHPGKQVCQWWPKSTHEN